MKPLPLLLGASLSSLLLLGCTKVLQPDDPRYRQIVAEASTEADNYYKTHPEYYASHPGFSKPGQLGYCHLHWGRMKQTIRKQYHLKWKSPPEEHPGVIYD